MEFVFEWVGVGVVRPLPPHRPVESGQKELLLNGRHKGTQNGKSRERAVNMGPFFFGLKGSDERSRQVLSFISMQL